MALRAGDRVGPYEVLSPIGAGGMGEVYRARDPRIGRDVAIKVLPESFAKDAERMRRFEREARSAGVLNHPNVIVVYDVGVSEGSPYIVSELLEGETLRMMLARGPLPTATAVDHGIRIAEGLAAAHERGILHRDLKPENLFVTRDGRMKILDFGLAKPYAKPSDAEVTSTPTESALTEAGVTLGTVGYVSPEQLCGQPADARADVFALGAVLYEMFTGQRAFRGGSPAETTSAILRDQPKFPAAAKLPSALEAVVRRCLEKDPAKRFHSARDVAFALADAMAEPGRAAPGSRRRPGSRRLAAVLAAATVAIAVGIVAVRLPQLSPRAPDRAAAPRFASLAVLPLANFSHDPGEEYFSDGMTEALVADLAQVSALRVISRTSVMQYKGSRKPVKQIASELDVDAVVEGSVVRAGDQVRITAQLIDARNDRHLWAHEYQRDVRDVLALQAEVARAIAEEVRATLSPREAARLAAPRPVDPAAQEAYLKGRYFLAKGTEDEIVKAIGYFRSSIDRDPTGARGYAGLSDAYSALRSIYRSPRAVMPQAKAAAVKAVELDDSLAEGHISLGFVRMLYDFDWEGAEKEFRRAIELNPNRADAHDGLALHLMANERRPEAVVEIEKALNLDPLSPLVLGDACWVYDGVRRYDREREIARQWVELDPASPWAHTYLGLALDRVGRHDEAIAELRKAASTDRSVTILEWLGNAYARAGRRDDARKILAELTGRAVKGYVCPYEIATVYAGLGEKDSAFAWLHKGVEERADCMPWVRGDAYVDVLRSDPRFASVLRGVGF